MQLPFKINSFNFPISIIGNQIFLATQAKTVQLAIFDLNLFSHILHLIYQEIYLALPSKSKNLLPHSLPFPGLSIMTIFNFNLLSALLACSLNPFGLSSLQ